MLLFQSFQQFLTDENFTVYAKFPQWKLALNLSLKIEECQCLGTDNRGYLGSSFWKTDDQNLALSPASTNKGRC